MNAGKIVGAGVFVVTGVLLFTAALFMVGERRLLFERRFPVYTEFSQLGQLETGAVVRVSGLDAGEVTEIGIPASPSAKFRVRMDVREDLHQLVRTDSVAATQTEGLVGAIFVNISAGTDSAPVVPEGGTIPGREPFGFTDLMQQASASISLVTETVQALRGDAERAVSEIAATAEESHLLVEEIRPSLEAIAQNGSRISADTREIMARINAGEGTIGKLIADDTLFVQARQIAGDARAVMENVREVSQEARDAIAEFRAEDGPASGLMADMRLTLDQARDATGDLADNMEALKRNFLFRGFFNRRGYFDLGDISPEEYRSGALESGDRKAMRIWLGADVLFAPGPDGQAVLTEEGRARLDSAMGTYLRYLPSNPLVVEGYATSGNAGERYAVSRARAGLVRQYVLERYGLLPRHTGAMALGFDAPGSPAGDQWDGVAVTLFLRRDEL